MGRPVQTQTYQGSTPPDPWSTATSTGAVATVYDAGAGPGGASGRLVTVTDQSGVARTNVQDALGRLVGVSEGCTGCVTTYTYDVLDNLRTVTQGAQQRTFAFDSLKRLSSATNPEDGTTNYSSYDSQGNLLAKTHVGDVTTNYTYDAQNRVTSKSYTSRTYTDGAVATPAAAYCYDGNVVNTSFTCSAASPVIPYSIGRLTGSGNSVSVTKYASYDALGRVTASQQTPNGQSAYQFSYTYNPAGGLTSITYPSNRTVSYLYDAAGRASAVKNGAANSTDNYATIGSYWPHGAVNQMTLGNTQTETSVYNDRLQPASLTVSGNLLALNYYYCTNLAASCTTNNGNLMSEVIGAAKYSGFSVTQNFTYDGVNRLLEAKETGPGGWTQTQGYDQWGNRWLASYVGLPPPSTSVPDATAFPGTNGNNNRMSSSGVAYDTAANLQLFNTADLRYDAENRLVKATKNSTVYTYGYDCEGRRVSRTSPNGTTTYVYDAQGQLAAEYGPAVENPDGGRRFLTADHLGSTRLVTDASGNDVVRYDYLPFGEEIGASTHGRTSAMGYGATTGLKQEFTGKERDAETGLDWFSVRYFSGAQGRMTSPDPFIIVTAAENREQLDGYLSNPQNWNRYAYALNNPMRYIDPMGLDPISVADCQKDSECTTVKVNVILDKNADIYDKDGNLRQEYQAKLDSQLGQAANEYGNAKIAFDVTYTSGTITSKDVVTGGKAGALNVVVTDSRDSYENHSWIGRSGNSYTRLNIGTSDEGTIAHEFAHHLAGDTRSWAIPLLSNAHADINNDVGRAILRDWNTRGGQILRTIDPFIYLYRRDLMEKARRWYGGR
jgi:RHS repeat-associated protein